MIAGRGALAVARLRQALACGLTQALLLAQLGWPHSRSQILTRLAVDSRGEIATALTAAAGTEG